MILLTRLVQAEIVADLFHGLPATGISGIDRLISLGMPPVIFWQRERNGPTLRLGHLAEIKRVWHLVGRRGQPLAQALGSDLPF